MPELGLPERSSGVIDPTIWYKDGCWHGADSLKAAPFWITETIDVESVVKTKIPSEIIEFCREWVEEKPEGPVYIVTGPVRGMQFIAVCTRSRSNLSWKSIGFIVPKSGLQPDKSVWFYSCSVNWISGVSAVARGGSESIYLDTGKTCSLWKISLKTEKSLRKLRFSIINT